MHNALAGLRVPVMAENTLSPRIAMVHVDLFYKPLGGVADVARFACGDMIFRHAGGSIVIVASVTSVRQFFILATEMTIDTTQMFVTTGQRESGFNVIEFDKARYIPIICTYINVLRDHGRRGYYQ